MTCVRTLLRRKGTATEDGLSATVRVDRDPRVLAARMRRGEIAVIDAVDLDRTAASLLVGAGAAAVVKAKEVEVILISVRASARVADGSTVTRLVLMMASMLNIDRPLISCRFSSSHIQSSPGAGARYCEKHLQTRFRPGSSNELPTDEY